ncbi:MAG: TPM domain-containing protein [Thiomonas sp.]
MNRLRGLLQCWLAALLLGVGAVAHAALVPVPALTAPVTDLTGTLTPQQTAALDQELRDFAARKGSQIAVLIVPSTAPEAIEQYSIRVTDVWKLGRKGQDDGVLLLVAKDDRTMRIEVGYGLEGAIPDAIAKRIIAEVITPQFKQGDFYGGLQDGVQSIMKLIDGEQLPQPRAAASSAGGANTTETAFFLLIAAIVVGSALRAVLGRTVGSGLAGLIAGGVGWLLIGSALLGLGLAVAAFFAVFSGVRFGGGPGGFGGGGFGGGNGSGGSGGSGGFSGGGGGFGGGGASGRW